jgi:hypothetical protein
MNSPFNSINENINAGSIWKPWLWIVLTVAGIVILISVWNWSRWKTSPWFSERATADKHFWDISEPGILNPVPETSTSSHSPSIESWCFVGEDNTGRWCVKVPNSHACDPDRTFSSQSDCELVMASHMPLGFLSQGGQSQIPLSAIPVMSNNTVV